MAARAGRHDLCDGTRLNRNRVLRVRGDNICDKRAGRRFADRFGQTYPGALQFDCHKVIACGLVVITVRAGEVMIERPGEHEVRVPVEL